MSKITMQDDYGDDLDVVGSDTARQWATEDGNYFATGDVCRNLPAGTYNVNSSFGRIFFTAFDLSTDTLYSLSGTAVATIIDQIQSFWDKKNVYKQHGLIHKRGILLYGPAGTGKSSIANVVVKEAVKKGAVTIYMGDSGPGLIAPALQLLRRVDEEVPAVVVIEDIDQWVCNEEMLDLLDGASQVNNIIFIATTNYPEKLPQRFKNRPSRFDRRYEIGYPDFDARVGFLTAVNGKEDKEFISWAEKTAGFTFAHLKELFISSRVLGLSVEQALDDLKSMSDHITSDDWEDKPGKQDAKKMLKELMVFDKYAPTSSK